MFVRKCSDMNVYKCVCFECGIVFIIIRQMALKWTSHQNESDGR